MNGVLSELGVSGLAEACTQPIKPVVQPLPSVLQFPLRKPTTRERTPVMATDIALRESGRRRPKGYSLSTRHVHTKPSGRCHLCVVLDIKHRDVSYLYRRRLKRVYFIFVQKRKTVIQATLEDKIRVYYATCCLFSKRLKYQPFRERDTSLPSLTERSAP